MAGGLISIKELEEQADTELILEAGSGASSPAQPAAPSGAASGLISIKDLEEQADSELAQEAEAKSRIPARLMGHVPSDQTHVMAGHAPNTSLLPPAADRPGVLGAIDSTARDLATVPFTLGRMAANLPRAFNDLEEIKQQALQKRKTGRSGSVATDLVDSFDRIMAPGGPLGPSRQQLRETGGSSWSVIPSQAIRGVLPSVALARVGAKLAPAGSGLFRRAAAGATAGATAWGLQEYADTYADNVAKGMNDKDAWYDAVLSGASEASWEGVSDLIGLGAFRGMLNPKAMNVMETYAKADPLRRKLIEKNLGAFSSWFKQNLAEKLVNYGVTAAAEGGTEYANVKTKQASSDYFGAGREASQQAADDAGMSGALGGLVFAALGNHAVGKERRRLQSTLADATASEQDRYEAKDTVVKALKEKSPEMAAVLDRTWERMIANQLPIEMDQVGVDETDPRGQLPSPASLATRTSELTARREAVAQQTPARAPGPEVTDASPSGLLNFLRERIPGEVDPEQITLRPADKLTKAQQAAQEEDAEAGILTVFYDGPEGAALPALSGGPRVSFVPGNLDPKDVKFKARHEKAHALDARPELDPLTGKTRDALAQAITGEEYAGRAQDLELDRADAGVAPASPETEFDEIAADIRAEGPYAARAKNPQAFRRNLDNWVAQTAEKDPGAFQRFKDTLQTWAANTGLPGVKLPDTRRGTAEQWAAVADAAMNELQAAEGGKKQGLRAQLVSVLSQVPGARNPEGGAGRQKVRDVTVPSPGYAARKAAEARRFADGGAGTGPQAAPAGFRTNEIVRHRIDGGEYRVLGHSPDGSVLVRPANSPRATPKSVPAGSLIRTVAPAGPAAGAQGPAKTAGKSPGRTAMEDRARVLGIDNIETLGDRDLGDAIVKRMRDNRSPSPRTQGNLVRPAPAAAEPQDQAPRLFRDHPAAEEAKVAELKKDYDRRHGDRITRAFHEGDRAGLQAAADQIAAEVAEADQDGDGVRAETLQDYANEADYLVGALDRKAAARNPQPAPEPRPASPAQAQTPAAPAQSMDQGSSDGPGAAPEPGAGEFKFSLPRRIVRDKEDGQITAKFSLDSYRRPNWSRRFRQEARAAGYSDDVVDNVLQTLEASAQLFESSPDILPGKGAKGKGAAPIKPNADFVKTLDINRLCRRTQKYYATINEIQDQVGHLLSPDEMISLAQEMRAKGDVSFCTFCYVEAGRRMRRYLEKLFLEADPSDIPKGRLATLRELLPQRDAALAELGISKADFQQAISSAARTREFKERYGDKGKALLDMFEKYALGAKGTLILPNGTYGHQILGWSRAAVDEFNSRAGLRAFSATDIDPTQIMDLNQAFADAMVKGLAAHAYSKDAFAALIYGRTGLKINLSIAADGRKGFKADTFNGMDWELAKRLRQEYPDAGTIFVAKNQEQLDWALGQDWIDYVIPHHAANWGFEGERRYSALDLEQLDAGQREEWVDKNAHPGESPKDVHGSGLWFTRFLKRAGNDQAKAVADYLQFCDENGIVPRFDRYRGHPGYIKLLKDYARTDSPQRPIDATKIDRGRMEQYLNEFVDRGGFSGDQTVDPAFVEEFVGKMQRGQVGTVEAIEAREQELAATRPKAKSTQTVRTLFPKTRAAQEAKYSLPGKPIKLRYAEGSTMASAAAKQFQGKPLLNADSGVTATVSNDSIGEMLSTFAVRRSINPRAHMQAVANLDRLFPIAIRSLSRPSKKGIGVKMMHHFEVPMPFGGEIVRVKIMAKEFERSNQGTRLYLVRAVEIEKPASMSGEPTSPTESTTPVSVTTAGFEEKFNTLLERVKRGDVFSESLDEAAPPESQADPDAKFSLVSSRSRRRPALRDPAGAERISSAWRERGLSVYRAAAYALKYLPAGGRPAEDIIGVIPEGKEYLQRVERAWWESKRKSAAWSRPLVVANRDLDKADRQYIRDSFLKDYEEGGVDQTWQSDAVAAFARAWRDVNDTVAGEAGKVMESFAGRDPDSYVPHRLTDVGRAVLTRKSGPEWDALVTEAELRGIDVNILGSLQDSPLRQQRYGSIDYARIANLPWEVTTPEGKVVKILETDPEVLFSHVRNAARRLSTIEEFGTDEATEEYHEQVAQGLIRAGSLDADAASETKEALQRIWKRLEGQDAMTGREVFGRAHGLWQAVDSVVAALNLSGAVIGNVVGGHLPESVRMGFVPTMKAFKEAYTTSLKDPSLDDLHALVDLEGDLLHELAATETLEGRVAKGAGKVLAGTGFVAANRRINLAVARAMQIRNMELMLDSIRKNDQGTWARRWGKDAGAAQRYLTEELKFSEQDVERMVLEGPTDQDLARAIGMELELVNAMNESPGGRPRWVAHPLWRMGFAYSTYVRKMYDTTKFAAREAKLGNVRPLATLLVSGTVTAEIMRAIKDFLKDREDEDKGFTERLANDMTETGAMGLAGAWKYAVTRLDDPNADFFSDAFKPPHLETIKALTEGIYKSVKNVSIRPLWKSTARVASGVDIIDKTATRTGLFGKSYRDQEAAERLINKVYLRDAKAKDGQLIRKALDPIPSKKKDNTSRRLIRRLQEGGRSDEEILEMIREAKENREGG